MRLKGKVALITGGVGALGRAVAQGLGQEGAMLSLAHVSQDQLLQTAVDLAHRGIRHTFRVVEVSSDQAVQDLVERTVENFGGLDVVVIISEPLRHRPLSNVTPAAWERDVKSNVTGAFLICRHSARVMKEARRGGRIITIVADRTGIEGTDRQLYCPLTAAVAMLSKGLASEMAPYGMTVNSICPALSSLLARADGEHENGMGSSGQNIIDVVVSLVCLLSGPEGGDISGRLFTGQTLRSES